MVFSAALGTVVSWRAPGLDRYSRDWLMRARGPLPPPEDIAIVAIDDASIARFGRFPWPRSLVARGIDAIAAARPRVVALDILYSDSTTASEDDALAQAIARAGNVVVAVQLNEARGGGSEWVRPLAAIERAAAATGHVNVSTEADSIARQLEILLSDDAGRCERAMAVEAVRLADGAPELAVADAGRTLLLGSRAIPAGASSSTLLLGPSQGIARWQRPQRMAIDYIGPAGSFGPHTYSFADLLDGRVRASDLSGKYVLIGATAASMGDRIASPFVHQGELEADQHGALMPGVEVLANAVNTILRGRFYSEMPDWLAFLAATLIAAGTLGLLAAAQERHELVKQLAALAGMSAGIVGLSYVAFTRLLVFPPLAPGLISFASAGVLGLLGRSLETSSRLDAAIADLGAALGANDRPQPWWKPPRGVEWKAGRLRELTARILARARFVDSALRSVEDGIIVSDPEGRVTMLNRRAAAIFGAPENVLVGRDLRDLLDVGPETVPRVVADRAAVEREITIRNGRPRRYILRLSPVAEDRVAAPPVLGIVASLSDITRQHELQQTKNDVVALVSHEMRTPLTAIQGMSELLSQFEVDPERRREMNLAMNEEVKRLTRMIDDYLDIARLESGKRPLRLGPVQVETVLERVVLLLEPIASKRNIRLVRCWPSGLPPVLADADLLSRAAGNLVSNAIKYSPEGAEVQVSASADDSAIRIEVADRGYGIPEADLERIFEKFYRVPRLEDAGAPGTGLGLALVREIAEMHGGAVSVKSAVGEGSAFSLSIPKPAKEGRASIQ